MKEGLIVGAAIGDCVHVAGVVNFLNLTEQLGYTTVCLGPAVSVEDLLDRVAALDPAIVAVGYRLTPENRASLLSYLKRQASARDAPHLRGNAAACGKIVTRMIGGACMAVDPDTGKPIREADRVRRILLRELGARRRMMSLARD
jgi:hypothetical protein